MSKRKVFVIDDERINIDILRGVLAEKYDIFAATSGAKALKILAKVKPDIILLDIMMPDMDGYETLAELREAEELKDIPVIFLTGNTDEKTKEKSLSLGVDGYLTKPVNGKELLVIIDELLK